MAHASCTCIASFKDVCVACVYGTRDSFGHLTPPIGYTIMAEFSIGGVVYDVWYEKI